MIIDFHTHCFPDRLAPRAMAVLSEQAGIVPFTDGTVADLKRSMDQAGIQISVLQNIATKPEQVVPINRWAAEIQDDRIVSFGTLHPEFADWKQEIAWMAANGIKGVKFHPDYQEFFVEESRLFPMYEALFAAGLVVLFHAGVDIGLPEPYHCRPAGLREVLDTFPGARIVAAHMGGYGFWDEVEIHLLGRDVFFDTSYSYADLGPAAMQRLIRGHGAGKILFGTDSPWYDQAEAVAEIGTLEVSAAEVGLILSENARKLLNL